MSDMTSKPETAYTLPYLDAADALEQAKAGAILMDVRKPPARRASGRRITGAEIRDPFSFGHADPLMTVERPVIAFCVHGHEVSQFACALLLVHGRTASYVRGGFEALSAAGALLEDLV